MKLERDKHYINIAKMATGTMGNCASCLGQCIPGDEGTHCSLCELWTDGTVVQNLAMGDKFCRKRRAAIMHELLHAIGKYLIMLLAKF